MSIQEDSIDETASAPHVVPSGDTAPRAAEGLATHLSRHLPRRAQRPPLLAAELTSLHIAALPRTTARQRPQILAFAIEERLGAAIDTVAVFELPRAGPDRAALALVVDRGLVAGLAQSHLPEVLALPRPVEIDDWHVWRDGPRAVVRAGDGTGFAVQTAALPVLWRRAGRPALIALADGLGDLPHVTASPPPPDSAELAFRIYPPTADPARHAWRPARIAAGAVFVALGLHLAVAAADTFALGQRAEAARAEAQVALARVLPEIAVTDDTGPLLTRLAPRGTRPEGSDMLPMLSEVTSALLTTGAGVTMRRISWGNGQLQALILAPRLEDLQTVEGALEAAGFSVRAGAASAGEGGAESEMAIERAS